MSSKKTVDLFSAGDLPTTAEDIDALRRHRPQPSSNWLGDLTKLAAQVPESASILRRRRTHAGIAPFEL